MYFAIHHALDPHDDSWRHHVQRHAAWLGMPVNATDETARCPGRLATCTYAAVKSVCAVTRSAGDWVIGRSAETDERNDISARVDFDTGDIHSSVPATAPGHLYYGADHRGRVVGNDFRLLLTWFGLEIDETAVYSMLLYGFVTPPHSLSKRIGRVPGGYTMQWTAAEHRPTLRQSFFSRDHRPSELPEIDFKTIPPSTPRIGFGFW